MPVIRRIRPCPTACGVLPGCVGWDRKFDNKHRISCILLVLSLHLMFTMHCHKNLKLKKSGTLCNLSQFHSSLCSGYCPPTPPTPHSFLFLSCWFGCQHSLWLNSIGAESLPVSLHPVLLLKVSTALNQNGVFCDALCFIQYPFEPSYRGSEIFYVYQDCGWHNPCAYKTFVFLIVMCRCEMWYVTFVEGCAVGST